MNNAANTNLDHNIRELAPQELANVAGGMMGMYEDGDGSKENRPKASGWESIENDPDHTFGTAGL